jgi:hypothetical protein
MHTDDPLAAAIRQSRPAPQARHRAVDTEPQLNLLRALRLLDDDPMSPAWRGSIDRAISDANAERYGVDPQPARLYVDLHATRDMTAAGVSGSQYLVGTSSLGRFLPSLQGSAIAFRLGAQRLDMVAENGSLPIVTTPPTTAWLGDEATAISTTQPVIGARTAAPKTIAALVTFSRQLALQANPAAERVLTDELARAVGAAVDDAVFNGTGAAGQPTGLLNVANTQSASGATIAWTSITDMIKDTTAAGAPMVAPGFAATGAVREVLMNREITASSGVVFTQDANRLAGYPLEASKTGPTGALIFTDWSNVYLPLWGLLEILVDPFTGFKSGLISMRAMLHVDTLFAHPSTVSIRTSVS